MTAAPSATEQTKRAKKPAPSGRLLLRMPAALHAELASTAEREGVSFIHPLGHERGWPQIKANFYQKLMGGMFRSAR